MKSINNLNEFTNALINGNGATYNFNSHAPTPTTGYMVSIEGRENISSYMDKATVSAYVQANVAELIQEGKYLGGWKDGDQFYLDVSRHFTDLKEAKQFGKDNQQLAIFDIEADMAIFI